MKPLTFEAIDKMQYAPLHKYLAAGYDPTNIQVPKTEYPMLVRILFNGFIALTKEMLGGYFYKDLPDGMIRSRVAISYDKLEYASDMFKVINIQFAAHMRGEDGVNAVAKWLGASQFITDLEILIYGEEHEKADYLKIFGDEFDADPRSYAGNADSMDKCSTCLDNATKLLSTIKAELDKLGEKDSSTDSTMTFLKLTKRICVDLQNIIQTMSTMMTVYANRSDAIVWGFKAINTITYLIEHSPGGLSQYRNNVKNNTADFTGDAPIAGDRFSIR